MRPVWAWRRTSTLRQPCAQMGSRGRPRSVHASASARMAAWASTLSARPIQAAYSPAALRGEPSNKVGLRAHQTFGARRHARCWIRTQNCSSPKLPNASGHQPHASRPQAMTLLEGIPSREQTLQERQAHPQALYLSFICRMSHTPCSSM